ncbi:hypothetical protein [Hydrogenimonas sp.]
MLKKLLILLTFLCAAAWAEPSEVDKEIAKIMAAPPEKRVEMMNAFKRRLFQMNQQERALAIQRLRGSMAPRQGMAPGGGMPGRLPHRAQRGPKAHPPQQSAPRQGAGGTPAPPPAAPGAGQGGRTAPPSGGAMPGAGRKPPMGGGMGRGGPHR